MELLNRKLNHVQSEVVLLQSLFDQRQENLRDNFINNNELTKDAEFEVSVICYDKTEQILCTATCRKEKKFLYGNWDDHRRSNSAFDTCYLLHDIEDHHFYMGETNPLDISYVDIRVTYIEQHFKIIKNLLPQQLSSVETNLKQLNKSLDCVENFLDEQVIFCQKLSSILRAYTASPAYFEVKLMQILWSEIKNKDDICLNLGKHFLSQRTSLQNNLHQLIGNKEPTLLQSLLIKEILCFRPTLHTLRNVDEIWLDKTYHWFKRINV